mgnify:FL=1
MDDRDAACLVLPDLDYEAQLATIRLVLRRHQEADDQLSREIDELAALADRTAGLRSDYVASQWVDRLHSTIYQDAAHSMAALGMLAPLIESVFHQAFCGIRKQFFASTVSVSAHPRWAQPAEDQWDCHFVWRSGRRRNSLVEGIAQLADAVDLTPHLPRDCGLVLQAMFEYRNKMFHHGFEWPIDERHRFAKRIDESGWPSDWFARATSGDAPWVFYMTAPFIGRCVELVEGVIEGIGAYCNQRSTDGDSVGEVAV